VARHAAAQQNRTNATGTAAPNRKIRSALTAFSLGLLAFAAHAVAVANPTAVLIAPDTFVQYLGTGPVGNNNINLPNKLFWMHESTGTWQGQAVDSWFVFFDPDPTDTRVKGAITFDHDILFLQDDQPERVATASFGKPGVTYDYSNRAVGQDANDKAHTSFAGQTLALSWTATAPGDHIRVMTAAAIPEPSTYALLAGGLFAVGFVARRRKAG
jgi:hypothetical protein